MTTEEIRARLHPASRCRIEFVPDGPALVRGAELVEDDEGRAHPASRPVVGICVCGLSQRQPWCDATHKVAPTQNRET